MPPTKNQEDDVRSVSQNNDNIIDNSAVSTNANSADVLRKNAKKK
jgi:hypothetical protein